MEKMINEYLDKIDQIVSDDFRRDLIEFSNTANNLNRFSLSMKSKNVLHVQVGNDNCICDILLKLDNESHYINIFKGKRRFINIYKHFNELYFFALKALNENIF